MTTPEDGRGTAGSGFIANGRENADPISESVWERACTFIPGATAGICSVVADRATDTLLVRKASARRSSTIVLSSLIASSISIFARRDSVLARGRLEFELALDTIYDILCGENDRELYGTGDNWIEADLKREVSLTLVSVFVGPQTMLLRTDCLSSSM